MYYIYLSNYIEKINAAIERKFSFFFLSKFIKIREIEVLKLFIAFLHFLHC